MAPRARKPAAKPGRPTDYTPELGERICDLLMCGGEDGRTMSLRAICRRPDMPHVSTVCRWLAKGDLGKEPYAGFLALYEAARSVQAELGADEMEEIADTPLEGVIETLKRAADGTMYSEVRRADMIEHRKLQISTRQWNAEKLRPKKYGQAAKLELSGANGAPLVPVLNVTIGRTEPEPPPEAG